MATRKISGTYSAGYILAANYRVLDITKTAEIGGGGLETTARATIDNLGTIAATSDSGAALVLGGLFENQASGVVTGGAGGAGIYLAQGGRIFNAGDLFGRAGGSGAGGGTAVSAAGYANLLSLYGAIAGGAGGAGGGGASAGGAGGNGVLLSAGGVVANATTISGGLGGRGGDTVSAFGGGRSRWGRGRRRPSVRRRLCRESISGSGRRRWRRGRRLCRPAGRSGRRRRFCRHERDRAE